MNSNDRRGRELVRKRPTWPGSSGRIDRPRPGAGGELSGFRSIAWPWSEWGTVVTVIHDGRALPVAAAAIRTM